MGRRASAWLGSWLAILATAAHAEAPLSRTLDAALSVRALRGAQVGALVVSRDEGDLLYARVPDRALAPASNQKILTAIAAFSVYGPTHHFPIEIFADAPPDAEGAVAELFIRAGGDPSLTSEDFWRLAADLRNAGLRRVRKGLVIDDSVFDAERWHPGWGAVSARAYHAPVGAFTVNYGAFSVRVAAAAESGNPVRVSVDPPLSFLQLTNRAITGPARGGLSLAVERKAEGDHERVEVAGSVPAGSDPTTYYRSVLDPVGYAGAVLRVQLEANGIAVEGDLRRGIVAESATPLLSFAGHPMAEVVRLFLKYSNNSIAESLVKSLGARATGGAGSWANGIPALESALAEAGLATEGMVVVDGSGLSYDNRVSPRQMVAALRLADSSFRYAPEFIASLPIAAADGTLKKRAAAAASAVRAKTGLLTRVTALSGFAEIADGTDVVFSLIVNGYRCNDERAMDAVDGFVSAMTAASLPPQPEPAPAAAGDRLP
jgi:D-alanyl-D-alanine carboxypeptidase/D-alanyl-D-alanine-endopeptidase (penicillin-binding protein 4)